MSFTNLGKQVEVYGIKTAKVASLHYHTRGWSWPRNAIDHCWFSFFSQEPSGLSLSWRCDHRIILKPGDKPIVLRPCQYPHAQKEEIEKQCSNMLQQVIIQPCQSPFSLPVLLVPKSTGTWRLWVDCCELNAKTAKDKFSILVSNEFLDELFAVQHFSKLNLWFGYH